MADNNKKVLVVEDEQDLREAVTMALEGAGFTVLQAGDGEEGLKLALAEQPDLIFLDIIMPKMDGLTMLTKLREDERGKSVRVIVMTVLDDLGKIAEVMEQGGNEYILKNSVSLAKIVEKAKSQLGM